MKEKVREQQNLFRQKAASTKALHLQDTHEQYERRTLKELALKEEKERELEKMAKLEMDLIVTLQKRQREQERAVRELESALAQESGSGRRGANSKRGTLKSGDSGEGDYSRPSSSLSGVLALRKKSPGAKGRSPLATPEPTDERLVEMFEAVPSFSLVASSGDTPKKASASTSSGSIGVEDVSTLLAKLGLDLNEEQNKECVLQLDVKQGGRVQMEDFLDWWRR